MEISLNQITMSSREIAELVQLRHDNVRRTIEMLANRGTIALPQVEEVSNLGPGPRFIKAFRIGKRDSYIIVAQLSPEFTARLVDRWQELESRVAQPAAIPQTLSEALRLAADLADHKARAEAALEIAAPKAQAFDRMSADTEALTITQAAKVLGVKLKELTSHMNRIGWVYRQNESWVAYAQHIQNGRLEYKEAHYTDEKNGERCVKPYCHILPKGMAILALRFEATKSDVLKNS